MGDNMREIIFLSEIYGEYGRNDIAKKDNRGSGENPFHGADKIGARSLSFEDEIRATAKSEKEAAKLRKDWTANPELMKTQSLARSHIRPQWGNKPTQTGAVSGQQPNGNVQNTVTPGQNARIKAQEVAARAKEAAARAKEAAKAAQYKGAPGQ